VRSTDVYRCAGNWAVLRVVNDAVQDAEDCSARSRGAKKKEKKAESQSHGTPAPGQAL
jgi:hypothetical protein